MGWEGQDWWTGLFCTSQCTQLRATFQAEWLNCAGRPIAWFGRPLLAYAMYLPAAVAGALLPYAAVPKPSQQAAVTHGAALAHAALAALMSAAGLKSGFALALWALTGVLCLLCPRQASSASTSFAPQCKHNSTEA